jgi:hypothetical protein
VFQFQVAAWILSSPPQGPKHPPLKWVPTILALGLKQPKPEAGYLLVRLKVYTTVPPLPSTSVVLKQKGTIFYLPLFCTEISDPELRIDGSPCTFIIWFLGGGKTLPYILSPIHVFVSKITSF